MINLEDLPNELFYILFNYFSIDELYKSFFRLNLRFNNLLLSRSGYYLSLESKTDPNLIDIFATKIKKIYIKKIDNFVSLTPFFNSLSVLVLGKLTEKYLDQLPFLVQLKHFEINAPIDSALAEKLYKYLVFPTQLRHLGLPIWYFEEKNAVFLSLHSFRLFSAKRENELISLFRHMPNLVYLDLYDPYVKQCQLIGDIIPNIAHNIINFHLHLTNGFTHSQLDFYLAHMSNIKSFHFSTSPCLVYRDQIGPYAILNAIADIVCKRLLNLRRFICFTTFEMRSNELFDITQIHTIYHQNYSIKIEKNTQKFQSIWRKN